MKALPVSAIALGVIATVGSIVWRQLPPSEPQSEPARHASPVRTQSAGTTKAGASISARTVTSPEALVPPTASQPSLAMETAGGLRVAANGSLIVDRRTLSLIKELAEVPSPEALQEELHALQQTLPPQAAAQARDLVERYYRFQVAFNERTPANQVIATPEEAGQALDRLHALRVEYFGRELAQRWFGEDEAFGRELIKNQLVGRR